MIMENISDVTVGPCENSKYIVPKRIHYTQNGAAKIWDVMRVHDGVAILLFNSSRNVFVFVRQFRPAIYINVVKTEINNGIETVDTSKYPGTLGLTIELCAGIVDKDKPVPYIAKAEVLEECGYDVPLENIKKITTCRNGVGTSGATIHLYYAEITDSMKVGPGGGIATEGEMIDIIEMTPEEMQIQIAPFCKDFNEKTAHIKPGIKIQTEVSVNPDRSYNIKLLTPPTQYFLMQAAGCQKGSSKPGTKVSGIITLKHIYEIAKVKSQDPSFACMSLEQVCKSMIGSAHFIGIKVVKGPLEVEELRQFLVQRAEELALEEKELEELRVSKMLRL
ncbi:unnamed protein product [Lymnaea stagnalis]|uniref:Large ribosomal subunit protein uL11m n=1 Tax=Lymnaea stagnalis TaxID=6523 RepID=A0AAV2GYX4_LYMST